MEDKEAVSYRKSGESRVVHLDLNFTDLGAIASATHLQDYIRQKRLQIFQRLAEMRHNLVKRAFILCFGDCVPKITSTRSGMFDYYEHDGKAFLALSDNDTQTRGGHIQASFGYKIMLPIKSRRLRPRKDVAGEMRNIVYDPNLRYGTDKGFRFNYDPNMPDGPDGSKEEM